MNPKEYALDAATMFLYCSNSAGARLRSFFDIVYPTTPNGSRPPPIAFATRDHPLTSFYMGSFFRFRNGSQFPTHAYACFAGWRRQPPPLDICSKPVRRGLRLAWNPPAFAKPASGLRSRFSGRLGGRSKVAHIVRV